MSKVRVLGKIIGAQTIIYMDYKDIKRYKLISTELCANFIESFYF
jgi:hypothetical protein